MNYNEENNNNTYSPLYLVDAIYKRLISIYPNIDSNTMNYYILSALHNMKNKDNNIKRQQSRIKRLKLNNNFNNWNYKL